MNQVPKLFSDPVRAGGGRIRPWKNIRSKTFLALPKSLPREAGLARLDRAAEDDVDIHEGLESTLTLIHNQLKDRVAVHKDYGDVPLVRCHPSRLNQVYMNLLVNASQAIEGKGEIHLKTYTSEGSVVVEVTDSGVGIPTGNLDRVFDPGFTTKGVKVGTGLGLSIVRRIVDEHNGKIELESKIGEGATFRLFLPIHSAT